MHTKAAMPSRGTMLGLFALTTSWLTSCVLPNEAFVDPLDQANSGTGPGARSEEDTSESSSSEEPGSSAPECRPTLCFRQNDDAMLRAATTLENRELAMRVSIPENFLLVRRVELMTGGAAVQSTLGLHASDAEQNPGNALISVEFAIQAESDWQGVDFNPPLRLGATRMPWVVWKVEQNQGVQASHASSGTPMSVFGRNAADQPWVPKVQNAMLRVYCCDP